MPQITLLPLQPLEAYVNPMWHRHIHAFLPPRLEMHASSVSLNHVHIHQDAPFICLYTLL
ncbi:hypothetical protein HanIR_Chr07g0325561 [Helianthus annuus]|nr:hypothetical protein HanIR_Chr07g0325561 [Helianthus annuus]